MKMIAGLILVVAAMPMSPEAAAHIGWWGQFLFNFCMIAGGVALLRERP